MKKLLVILLIGLMMGCQSQTQTHHYQYVVEHLFSTQEITYLNEDMINNDNQKIMDEFKKVYGDYVTERCLTTLVTELSVFQTIAYSKDKDMSVSHFEMKENKDYMEIKCKVKVNNQEEDIVLHGQELDGKISSLRLMNGEELDKILQ